MFSYNREVEITTEKVIKELFLKKKKEIILFIISL